MAMGACFRAPENDGEKRSRAGRKAAPAGEQYVSRNRSYSAALMARARSAYSS